MMDAPIIEQPKEKLPKSAHPKRQDVMPAVKQEHGDGGRKNAVEIVQQVLMQQTGDPRAVNVYMTAMAQQVNAKLMRLIQFGNTVFMATQKAPGVIDVHVFTEDSPKTLAKRFQQAYQWAKQNGFTRITSTLMDGNVAQLVKAAGIPVSLQQTTINDGKQMRPAYQMIVEVK
jgi:hypothetical protein